MIDLCDLFPISGLFIDFHIWIELIVNTELALLFMHQSENELYEVRILKIGIASPRGNPQWRRVSHLRLGQQFPKSASQNRCQSY